MSFLVIFQRKRCKGPMIQPVAGNMKNLWVFFLLILPCLATEPLRIVSYNIRHGAGLDGKVDLQRIAKVIAKEKPEVVTLQEVDQECTRSGSVDQAAELGRLLKMEHRFGKFMDFQGGEYGMAVLSRFPIEKTFPAVRPRVEIDFFFEKGLKGYSFEDRVVEDLRSSDHCLIALELNPTKASE
jgi:endonuclease/exonuclease/phosphatase family metal-dependent hydrolase